MKPEVRKMLADATDPGGPAVFGSIVRLRPGTGWEHPVLRAAVYADGSKTWDPENKPAPGPVVSEIERDGRRIRIAIVESVEARAHDLTWALRGALEESGAGVPCLELHRGFDGRQGVDLIADSWEAPHRVADPYWREARLPDPPDKEDQWPRFFETDLGRDLDPSKPLDPAVLLRCYPTALLFGCDPRAAILSAQSGKAARRRGGETRNTEGQTGENGKRDETGRPRARSSMRPFGRLCRSEIVAEIDGLYWRTQSLRRPVPAMSDATIYQTPDGDWSFSEDRAARDKNGKPIRYPGPQGKEAGRASSIGLDDVTPSVRPVPDIYAKSVTLSSYVSLAGIRAVRFPSLNEEQTKAAHMLCVAMGIAAVLGAERDLHVRSDCDLVLADGSDAIVRELSYSYRPSERFGAEDVGYEDACELLAEAVEAAKEQGVWKLPDPNPVVLVATRELASLLGATVEPGGEG